MTEAEARAALAAFVGVGHVVLQGWRFRLEVAPGGVRVVASAGKGEPAVWFVPRRG